MNTLEVKKVTLGTQLIDAILGFIENGEWQPGKKLPNEIELAASFDVSRNIMREALKVLENYGVLDGKTGKGTHVSENAMTSIYSIRFFEKLKANKSIEKCLETRLIIEPELAYYAALRCTPEEIEHLKACSIAESVIIDPTGLRNDFDFHANIAKFSQNDILENLICSILSQLRSGVYNEYNAYVEKEKLIESANDHFHVVEAIERRDPLLAKERMHKHLFTRISQINSAYDANLMLSIKIRQGSDIKER